MEGAQYMITCRLTGRSSQSLESRSLCRVIVSMSLKWVVHTPLLILPRMNQLSGRMFHQTRFSFDLMILSSEESGL